MPRMDGFELTRRLKAEERFRRTPIIIVTSRGDEADRKRGLEAGADAYLVKSAMQHGDLLECARRLIG
jgi:DNA-binding response OmpR family regulator